MIINWTQRGHTYNGFVVVWLAGGGEPTEHGTLCLSVELVPELAAKTKLLPVLGAKLETKC